MRFYEWITLGYYLALVLLGWHRSLPWRRRAKVTGIAIAGLAGMWISVVSGSVIRNWLPVLLIPLAYGQAGQFVLPVNLTFQMTLQKFDQKPLLAFIRFSIKSAGRRYWSLVLEFAYLFCYPLVPCGLAALYLTGMARFAEEFWNIVVPPAYVCYATFPFVQTLPPRAIENAAVWQPQQSRIRTLNLFVLRHVSIQANTFPSGHVAASLAIALELTRLAPTIGSIFLCFAIGIAAGAVIGRYHYVVDVLLGMALAVVSFWIQVGL